MTCKKCGATLSEDTLICPTCGEKVALANQEEKVKATKQKVSDVLTESFSSKLFLALTICLTVTCVFSFIAAIGSIVHFSLWNLVKNLLLAIFSLISVLACWKLHGKKVPCNGENVKKYNKYNSLAAVLETISAVFTGIICFLILIVFVLGGACSLSAGKAAGSTGTDEGAAAGGALAGMGVGLIIIGILVVVAVMAIVINIVIAYKQTKNYGKALADTADSNQYKPSRKPPYIRLFIIGGFIALGGLMTILSSLFMNSLITGIVGSLDLGESADMVDKFVGQATSGNFLTNFMDALPELAAGGYLIITALFFKSIDNKEEALAVELTQAQEEYDQIATRTEAEVHENLNKQRLANEQKNQQMQDMLNMMMMNQLNNQNNNNNNNNGNSNNSQSE